MESRFDYVVFDIETTGLRPETAQIAEIAAIGIANEQPVEMFSTFVSIEGDMPPQAARVNHITKGMLEGAPSIAEALDEFFGFVGEGAVIVGHNIEKFDIPFISHAAEACGKQFGYMLSWDTLMLAEDAWPHLGKYSMDTLRQMLGIGCEDAHRALADCCDELLVYLAEFDSIGGELDCKKLCNMEKKLAEMKAAYEESKR